MAESHVISALTAKRAELAGLIDHHRKEITRISDEVKTLDATIRIFEPEYRISLIKKKRFQKKNEFFKHGEGGRTIMDILRESGEKLSTNAVTKIVAQKCGIEAEKEKALQATVLAILHSQCKNGVVESSGSGVGRVWGIGG